ncbi:MAG TPA: hypothetical protein VIV11_05950 [Kofleriaceae bacterium]
MRWILFASMLAGCDVIWSIDHVGPRDGGGGGDDGDSSSTDAPDAPTGACVATEHDEDDDAVPDRCDKCPGIADSQGDMDTDGVGDACDPSSAQHMIAKFISFTEPSTTWMGQTGSWLPDGESLKYNSFTDGNHHSVKYTGTLPNPPYVIDVHFQIDVAPQEVLALYMWLDTNQTVSGGTGAACSYERFSGLNDAVRAHNTDSGQTGIANFATQASPGGYRLRATYDRSTNLICFLSADDSIPSGTAMEPTGGIMPGAFGFRSYKVGFTLHSITFIKAL